MADDHKDEPKLYNITLRMPTGERLISVVENEHIWDAALREGIRLPAMCHQGWCLTCAGRMEGIGEVEQSDSVAYFPQDREGGFVLLCTAKPRTDLRINTHQAVEMRKQRLKNHLPAPYSRGLVLP